MRNSDNYQQQQQPPVVVPPQGQQPQQGVAGAVSFYYLFQNICEFYKS